MLLNDGCLTTSAGPVSFQATAFSSYAKALSFALRYASTKAML